MKIIMFILSSLWNTLLSIRWKLSLFYFMVIMSSFSTWIHFFNLLFLDFIVPVAHFFYYCKTIMSPQYCNVIQYCKTCSFLKRSRLLKLQWCIHIGCRNGEKCLPLKHINDLTSPINVVHNIWITLRIWF